LGRVRRSRERQEEQDCPTLTIPFWKMPSAPDKVDAGLWEVVSFPAIAEIDEEHIVETPFGRKTFVRRTGDALHAERESVETLARIRSAIGEYNFAGQYQQTPAPAGGGMVKEPWFCRYRPDQRPESFDQIVQSWDTANKPSELADYSVCTTWGVKGPTFYLLDVLRKKLAFPDFKRASLTPAFRASRHTNRTATRSCACTPKPPRSRTASSTCPRPHTGSPTIFTNSFYSAPASYDDQVDSTAQTLAWTKFGRPDGEYSNTTATLSRKRMEPRRSALSR